MNSSSDTQKSGTANSFSSEFEKLLNDTLDRVKPGRIIPGTITDVNKDFVTVDIGYKSEGIIPVNQFIDSEGKIAATIGDRVDVLLVAHENDDGQVVLSKEKADQIRIWKEVEEKLEKGEMIRGRVVQKVKGGLQVDIGIPAFLPGSQIDMRPHRNLDKFLGESFDFKVLKITKENGNIVLSRRAVLESERNQLKSETLKVLQEGVVMEGTVKNITDYGAFIDLGGVDGLLYITDVSWGRINHPSEKLSIGQVIPVVVLKYDQENQRVSLGMKQLKVDPWLTVTERYPVGARIGGKVVAFAEYGAFIEVEEGVEGLIHVSDLSWTKKVKHPSKILAEGENVEAVILGVDVEGRKLSLGLKQTQVNPWDDLVKQFPVGTKVEGKVKSITDFGIFIGVSNGIDGLIHVSDFSWTKRIKDPKEIHDMFKKGDTVSAVVLEVDPAAERLSLGIKQLESDPWENISQRYPLGAKVKGNITSITDFGIFVEIEQGIEGLIHSSQLGLDKGQDIKEFFQVGTQIEAEVTNIEKEERRISLSVKAIKRRKEQEAMAGYMEDPGQAITFGDLIREKIGMGNDKK